MDNVRTIEYTVRSADDPDGYLAWQLKLTRCTMVEMAVYRKGVREVLAWYEKEAGHPFLVDIPSEEEVQEELWPHIQTGMRRARMLASLSQFRCRTDPEQQDWDAADWPKEWGDIPGFTFSVPPLLFETWDRNVLELNPNLWAVSMTDDAKKEGWISVS
ncbi:MAG: hypothetical protein LC687_03665 [Actinobacteria bacterium]|nr:hypothetical protein [Actinomycetota bacterium]